MMLYTDVILEHSDVQMARTGCDMGESENWGQPLSLVNRLAHVHEQPLRYPLTRILASPCVRAVPVTEAVLHQPGLVAQSGMDVWGCSDVFCVTPPSQACWLPAISDDSWEKLMAPERPSCQFRTRQYFFFFFNFIGVT